MNSFCDLVMLGHLVGKENRTKKEKKENEKVVRL